MKLIRVIFLGLAVLLPSAWTMAAAGDEAPAEEKPAKKAKKGKKGKADKAEGEGDKPAE